MNLSTEDSSSTNNIAIIFDCLYRFLKYGSSAQVRYVGGFFAATERGLREPPLSAENSGKA
jgi:hypothetical protein